MINFNGAACCQQSSNSAALSSGATVYMHFKIGDLYVGSGERTLFYSYLGFRVGVSPLFSANALYIIHTGSTQDGYWIYGLPSGGTNVDIQLAFTYDFSAGAPARPVVYANGSEMTYADITDPIGATAIGASALTVGGMSIAAGGLNTFEGYIGEWGVLIGTKLTEAQLAALTSTQMMRQPLQYGFTHYYPMDEASEDEALLTASSTIVPDSDVAISWSTAGTHWDKIDADDGSYITADKNDDNEKEIYGVTTSGVPVSVSRPIRRVTVSVKYYQSTSVNFDYGFLMDGTWYMMSTTSSSGSRTDTFDYYNSASGWLLSSMQLSVDSNTMASGDDIQVYYLYATLYYGPVIMDYVAGNHLRYGGDAVGFTNNYLSY